MIRTETHELNGTTFRVCRSDSNHLICKTNTGELYAEAWERRPSPCEYEETYIKLPSKARSGRCR